MDNMYKYQIKTYAEFCSSCGKYAEEPQVISCQLEQNRSGALLRQVLCVGPCTEQKPHRLIELTGQRCLREQELAELLSLEWRSGSAEEMGLRPDREIAWEFTMSTAGTFWGLLCWEALLAATLSQVKFYLII